jgi:ketosteroid isomerase-like protein
MKRPATVSGALARLALLSSVLTLAPACVTTHCTPKTLTARAVGGPAADAADRAFAAEQELFAADAAFAHDADARGLDGWLSWYADDAVRMDIDGFLARGRDAIRAHDGPLFEDRTLALSWNPAEAGADPDGAHGWTRGRFSLVRHLASGATAPVASGHYLTIWRRDPAGWKVVLDTGVADADEAQPTRQAQ